MTPYNNTSSRRITGRIAAWTAFVLMLTYTITTVSGILSLKSPGDPIGDPYLFVMEVLRLLTAPLMVIIMVEIHTYAAPGTKKYSLIALIFMIFMAGVTTCVHLVSLIMGRQFESVKSVFVILLISLQVFIFDILAQNWFFALSLLFAAPVFIKGRLEKSICILLIISGLLCIAGFLGMPLLSPQFRNITTLGYGVFAPISFVLLATLFGRRKEVAINAK